MQQQLKGFAHGTAQSVRLAERMLCLQPESGRPARHRVHEWNGREEGDRPGALCRNPAFTLGKECAHRSDGEPG